jgi:hypothetical protein
MNDPLPPMYAPSIIDVSPPERSPTQPPPSAAERQPPPSAAERPTPDAVLATQRYFIDLREDLTRQVRTIEAFLGFTEQTTDLTVRVAKIEAFLGLKG